MPVIDMHAHDTPERFKRAIEKEGSWYGLPSEQGQLNLGNFAAGVDVRLAAMDAAFVRTLWAVVGLSFWGLMARELIPWLRPLKNRRNVKIVLIASVIGAFLGTWLSVAALKYTHASVAATLNSTGPLFILPLSIWYLKERVSTGAMLGALAAVAGIGLYFSFIDGKGCWYEGFLMRINNLRYRLNIFPVNTGC